MAEAAATALTRLRSAYMSREMTVCTLPGTWHTEIYLMFCFPDMYVLVLWSSTNDLALCNFRSYPMNVNRLQDYTTMVSFGFYLLVFFFTLLIIVIYCFHCERPNLKYWSIWSNPSIKKLHSDVKFLLSLFQHMGLHMRLVKEGDQHFSKKDSVWDWHRKRKQWG